MSSAVPSKLLVCGECLAGLVERGAVPSVGPREGSLLDRCQAHTPASVEVHAMHVVWALPEVVEAWKEACKLFPPALSVRPEDSELVARLAAQLLAGMPGAQRVEIEQAVYTARAILASAKGIEP